MEEHSSLNSYTVYKTYRMDMQREAKAVHCYTSSFWLSIKLKIKVLGTLHYFLLFYSVYLGNTVKLR